MFPPPTLAPPVLLPPLPPPEEEDEEDELEEDEEEVELEVVGPDVEDEVTSVPVVGLDAPPPPCPCTPWPPPPCVSDPSSPQASIATNRTKKPRTRGRKPFAVIPFSSGQGPHDGEASRTESRTVAWPGGSTWQLVQRASIHEL